jgi:hypothetical protein
MLAVLERDSHIEIGMAAQGADMELCSPAKWRRYNEQRP